MWASASVEGSVELSLGRAVRLVLAGVKGDEKHKLVLSGIKFWSIQGISSLK